MDGLREPNRDLPRYYSDEFERGMAGGILVCCFHTVAPTSNDFEPGLPRAFWPCNMLFQLFLRQRSNPWYTLRSSSRRRLLGAY